MLSPLALIPLVLHGIGAALRLLIDKWTGNCAVAFFNCEHCIYSTFSVSTRRLPCCILISPSRRKPVKSKRVLIVRSSVLLLNLLSKFHECLSRTDLLFTHLHLHLEIVRCLVFMRGGGGVSRIESGGKGFL